MSDRDDPPRHPGPPPAGPPAPGRGGRAPEWWRRGPALAELGVVLGLSLFYALSFHLASPVNGPHEVFGQDSRYILEGLERGKPYRWNPQSHLFYHHVVERGHAAWQTFFGSGIESTYRYLKLFTAACGLAFLAAMRWLFCELGLTVFRRVVLLLLTGVTLTAWFHFAAIETHALALPALAVYLVAAARLRNRSVRGGLDPFLLVGSLVVCGWTRVDLLRIAAVSTVWLMLPCLGRRRRALVGELALAAALIVAGTTWMAHTYLGVPLARATTLAFTREERPELRARLGRLANVGPENLTVVGRAISLYALVMPVEARAAGRSFLAPPSYALDLRYSGKGPRPSTRLFLEPARNLLGAVLPLLAAGGVAALLLWAAARSVGRAVAGDAFHTMLGAQALVGWLLYTWFNPHEPFLWTAEFMPLWIAMIGDRARSRGRVVWTLLALLALSLAAHNWFAFYVPFRDPA